MTWSKSLGLLLLASTWTVVAGAAVACGGSASESKTAASSGSGDGHAEVGKPAPELSVQTLNDKGKISLDSMQGKVVVVDFWATWCGPCKQSFPKLEALSKKVSDKVVIVGVSVDDEKKGIVEFAKENGASFAIGWDEGHTIANRWKVGTMPTTFIVDATGKVRHIHDGYHDGETDVMEKELNVLVSEAGSTPSTANAKTDDTAKPADTSAAADAGAPAPTDTTATAAPAATDTTPVKPAGKKKKKKKKPAPTATPAQ